MAPLWLILLNVTLLLPLPMGWAPAKGQKINLRGHEMINEVERSFPFIFLHFPKNCQYLSELTILSLRPMSSSSSFFLCSKCTSIRVCSSSKSFSIRFLWMSWWGKWGVYFYMDISINWNRLFHHWYILGLGDVTIYTMQW